ncbi:MAG: MAPEG family protein [Parvularculaceae bacterium]
MQGEAILAPMGALALLTFLVLINIPIRRFAAAAAGKVKRDDFKFGESANVPPPVTIPNRNYMNLLEMPVLFYVICFIALYLGRADGAFVALAWIYVALRAAHSAIHLTYNNVFHRLTFFALSNFVVIAMWATIYAPLLRIKT